jgi:hypothetical protein
MGQRFTELSARHVEFIARQRIFFVGTATADSRVNVSPKGMDSLKVLDNSRIAWLNVTGSGNETSAHVQQLPRMTLMFAAFEGPPLILRVYGTAKTVHHGEPGWTELISLFPPLPGARQVFDMTVELVQTSCGTAVPLYDHAGDREILNDWARKKGEQGVRRYWEEKNTVSIDGLPTNIVAKTG